MGQLRDYEEWHRRYDDPGSDLSWRLRIVQGHIAQALDRHAGLVRVLSCCSGDGRDLLEVLAQRLDADRVHAVLVEIHPAIAERARRFAADTTAYVEVRVADAGLTDSYIGAVPSDLVLLVGVLGNVSDRDLARTIATSAAFCKSGATLVWTRGRFDGDSNDIVRGQFAAAGFSELDYAALDRDSFPAVGVVRYDGPAMPLGTGARLFTFMR